MGSVALYGETARGPLLRPSWPLPLPPPSFFPESRWEEGERLRKLLCSPTLDQACRRPVLSLQLIS